MSNLIKCKGCDQEVSPDAKACPKCGAPVKKKTGCLMMIVYVFLGLFLLAIIVPLFSGGSSNKSESQSSTHQDASIALLNIYSSRKEVNGGLLITELENTGKVGIIAFQGKWTVKDDLDATIAEQDIRFTSDTPYLTPEGNKSPHVISAGEKLVIINGTDDSSGSPKDITLATAKENLTNLNLSVSLMQPLDNFRVTRKISFEVEKVVTQ